MRALIVPTVALGLLETVPAYAQQDVAANTHVLQKSSALVSLVNHAITPCGVSAVRGLAIAGFAREIAFAIPNGQVFVVTDMSFFGTNGIPGAAVTAEITVSGSPLQHAIETPVMSVTSVLDQFGAGGGQLSLTGGVVAIESEDLRARFVQRSGSHFDGPIVVHGYLTAKE